MKFNVKRPFIFHLILLVYIYIYYPSWLILSIKNRAWVGFLLNGQNLLSMTKVIGQQSLIYLIGVPYKMWLKIAARMLHVIFLKNIQNDYFHHQPFFHICSNSLTPSLPPAKKGGAQCKWSQTAFLCFPFHCTLPCAIFFTYIFYISYSSILDCKFIWKSLCKFLIYF